MLRLFPILRRWIRVYKNFKMLFLFLYFQKEKGKSKKAKWEKAKKKKILKKGLEITQVQSLQSIHTFHEGSGLLPPTAW